MVIVRKTLLAPELVTERQALWEQRRIINERLSQIDHMELKLFQQRRQRIVRYWNEAKDAKSKHPLQDVAALCGISKAAVGNALMREGARDARNGW